MEGAAKTSVPSPARTHFLEGRSPLGCWIYKSKYSTHDARSVINPAYIEIEYRAVEDLGIHVIWSSQFIRENEALSDSKNCQELAAIGVESTPLDSGPMRPPPCDQEIIWKGEGAT